MPFISIDSPKRDSVIVALVHQARKKKPIRNRKLSFSAKGAKDGFGNDLRERQEASYGLSALKIKNKKKNL